MARENGEVRLPRDTVILIYWSLFLCKRFESFHDNGNSVKDNALDHGLAHPPDKRLSLGRGLVRSPGSQMRVERADP
jgi:hypothetical protein